MPAFQEQPVPPTIIRTTDHVMVLTPYSLQIHEVHEDGAEMLPETEPQCTLAPDELIRLIRGLAGQFPAVERGQRELEQAMDPVVQELLALLKESNQGFQSRGAAYRAANTALTQAIVKRLPATEAWYQHMHATQQYEVGKILVLRQVTHRLLARSAGSHPPGLEEGAPGQDVNEGGALTEKHSDEKKWQAMLDEIGNLLGPSVELLQFADPASDQVIATYPLPQSANTPIIRGHGDAVISGNWYTVTYHHNGGAGESQADPIPLQIVGIRPHDHTYSVFYRRRAVHGMFSAGYPGGSFWRTFTRVEEADVDPFLRNALPPLGTATTLRQITKEQLLTVYRGRSEVVAHVVLAYIRKEQPPFIVINEAMPIVLSWKTKRSTSASERQELASLALTYPEVWDGGKCWAGGELKIDRDGTLVNQNLYQLRLFHPDGAGQFLMQVLEHCELAQNVKRDSLLETFWPA